MGRERRTERRQRKRFKIVYGLSEPDLIGFSHDVSSGGLFLCADRLLPLGSRLLMRVEAERLRAHLEGVVVRHRVVPTSVRAIEPQGMGVRFLTLAELLAPLIGTPLQGAPPPRSELTPPPVVPQVAAAVPAPLAPSPAAPAPVKPAPAPARAATSADVGRNSGPGASRAAADDLLFPCRDVAAVEQLIAQHLTHGVAAIPVQAVTPSLATGAPFEFTVRLDFTEGRELVAARGRILQVLPGNGGGALVVVGLDGARALIEELRSRLLRRAGG